MRSWERSMDVIKKRKIAFHRSGREQLWWCHLLGQLETYIKRGLVIILRLVLKRIYSKKRQDSGVVALDELRTEEWDVVKSFRYSRREAREPCAVDRVDCRPRVTEGCSHRCWWTRLIWIRRRRGTGAWRWRSYPRWPCVSEVQSPSVRRRERDCTGQEPGRWDEFAVLVGLGSGHDADGGITWERQELKRRLP